MITFEVITVLPEIFSSYIRESLIARAIQKKLIGIKVHNLRKWTKDKHKTVDGRPFGGGLGMVLMVEPFWRALREIIGKKKSKKKTVILFTPRGKKFTQTIAQRIAKLDQVVFICGRYEGVDERVAQHLADIELSIGDYDLMGGELPAMVVIEAVSRLIPGVIGKEQLLKERVTSGGGFIEYIQYTRPEVFQPHKGIKWSVPKVLLSGDHNKIEEWKKKHRKIIGGA